MKLKTLGTRITPLGSRIKSVQTISWRAEKKSSTARGYGYKWQKARAQFLTEHPVCECDECTPKINVLLEQYGMPRNIPSLIFIAASRREYMASVVDHIEDHRGDQELFWRVSNWRAMTKACHDKRKDSKQSEVYGGR